MEISNAVRACWLLVLSVCGSDALTADDLDAELDAQWGSKRVKTLTVETPKGRYEARMKLIEAARNSEVARCKAKAGGSRYCANYAEERFRRNLRVLQSQFEDQLDDMPQPEPRSRIKR